MSGKLAPLSRLTWRISSKTPLADFVSRLQVGSSASIRSELIASARHRNPLLLAARHVGDETVGDFFEADPMHSRNAPCAIDSG